MNKIEQFDAVKLNGIFELAEKGYRLIPISHDDKKPLLTHWPEMASNDMETLQTWKHEFPGCNWAVMADGLLIIDIDIREDATGFDHLERLKEAAGVAWEKAPCIHTPSEGMHVYFRLTEAQKKDRRIRQGSNVLGKNSCVDVRTGNAYALVPPSCIKGRPYTGQLPEEEKLPVAPEALIDVLYGGSPTPPSSDEDKTQQKYLEAIERLPQKARERLALLLVCKKQGILDPEAYQDWQSAMFALANDVCDGTLQESEAWSVLKIWSRDTAKGLPCRNYDEKDNHRQFMHACQAQKDNTITFGTIHHRVKEGLRTKVPAGGAVEALREAFQELPLPRDIALEAINQDWVFIRAYAGNKPYYNMREARAYSEHGFLQHLRPVKIAAPKGKPLPAAREWMDWAERNEVDISEFAPTQPRIYQKGKNRILNRFNGFEVQQPAIIDNIEQEIDIFLRHIRERICQNDEALCDQILKLLAWQMQNLDQPGQKVLVLRGGQGTGKTLFGKIFLRMYAPFAMETSSSEKVTGRFNGHLEDKLFLLADEAFFAGYHTDRRQLKALITDRHITYEQKGRDPHQGKNHLRIIMTTNDNWAVAVDSDDRRFVVVDAAPRQEGDDAYFTNLANAINDDVKIAAFREYLTAYPLGSWHPMQMFVHTRAYLEQKIASLNPIQSYLYECLKEGQLIQHDVSSRYRLLEWPEDKEIELRRDEKEAIRMEIARMAGLKKTVQQSQVSKVMKNWAGATTKHSSSENILILPPLNEARRRFEEKMGCKIDWEE